ncbi:MAG: hypothetical protein F4W90_11495 [Gammaproteobacteria bacterium]|nr:hypothetical protein [Gammaproteobacteria bacterium]
MNDLIKIFTNPASVFAGQSEDSSWLMPALAIILFGMLSAIVVATRMDMGGAMDAGLEQSIEMLESRGATQEEIDSARAQMEAAGAIATNPLVQIGGQVIAVPIMFFLIVLVHALYFKIVGKMVGADLDYSDWLALSVWGRMPWVVGSIVILLAALLMDAKADPSGYNLLAFSTYISLPNADGMFVGQLVKTADLLMLWSIAIMTIGYSVWTEKSMATSLAIVAVPYVLIYAVLFAV